MVPWKRKLLPLAAMCGARANACSSSSSGSAPDAASDGASQTGEDAATPPQQDAAAPDATVSDAAPGDGSTDASPTDGAGPNGDASDGGPSDGGASDAGPSDGGASDGASDGAGIATHLLVPGTTFTVGGITGDNYVVYYDNSTQTYYAEPLSGGPATTIYTAPATAYAGYFSVIGNVAFVWSWDSSYVGTLTAWSSGMTQGASLTSDGLAYLYQTMWASEDSKHVAYLQGTDFSSNLGALYGANADGTGVTLLLPSIDINTSYAATKCFPRLVFRGDYAVVSYCTVGDGGASLLIQSFSISNGWAPTAIVPNFVQSFQFNILDRSPFTFSFAVDPDGGRIAAASTTTGNGAIQVFPIDGGPGTVVDPNAVMAPSLSFAGSVVNPWSILYNNDAGALNQAYATNPTPQTLVDAGVNFFNAISNDGKWLLVSNQENNGGWFADLSLVGTQAPGAPVLVASSNQYGGLPITPSGSEYGGNRGFTADSAYALATTNMTQDNAGSWIGYLRSMLVTSPNTSTLLTNGYMAGYATLRGSKVLVTDNFQDSDGGSRPTVDLDVVDPASSGGSVTIARAVPGDNAVSSDMTQIAYSVVTGAAPGIYVSPLP